MTDIGDRAEQLGQEVHHSETLDGAVRFGMIAYGVVHLLVAWLAVQLAFGQRHENASSKGAMQTLAKEPLGPVLLWLVAVGMFALVLWRVVEVLVGHREYSGGRRWRKRATSAFKAVVYGYIGVTALRFAVGTQSGDSTNFTARLMTQPLGRWLVGAVGIAIVGYGLSCFARARHLSA